MSILSQFTPPNTSAFPSDLSDTLSIPPHRKPPILSSEDPPDASLHSLGFPPSSPPQIPEDLRLLATTESPGAQHCST